jgi:uncharacterized protein (TIGR03435 family)
MTLRRSLHMGILICSTLLIAGVAAAQTSPVFDVVAIRRNQDAEAARLNLPAGVIPGPVRPELSPGRLVATGISLGELVREAFGFQRRPPSDVTGGPDWMDRERYDVQATFTGEVGVSVLGALPVDVAMRLRAALGDRFGLKHHMETRERQIYEMVMARPDRTPGPSLVPSEGKCLGIYTPSTPGVQRCPFRLGGGEGFDTENITMPELAMFLSVFPAINTTVIDKTDLKGSFDIKLRFRGIASDLNRDGSTSPYPLLIDALPEQLYLKLQRTKGFVEVLVVDDVRRPTAN